MRVKFNRKFYILLISIFILSSLTLSLTSCSKKEQELESKKESELQTLKTYKVTRGDLEISQSYVGRIESKRKDILYFEVDGIVNYLFDVGDKVKEGEAIAKVDSESVKKNTSSKEGDLKSAEDGYERILTENHFFEINAKKDMTLAKKDYETAKLDYESAKINYKNSLKTKEDELTLKKAKLSYEKAKINYENKPVEIEEKREEYKYKISQAQVKLNDAQKELNESKKDLEKIAIYAPYDCQIIHENKESGEKITAHEDVLTVAGLDEGELEVKIKINEVDVSKISLNANSEITLDAYPGEIMSGKISYISPIAKTTESGTYYDGIVDITDRGNLENISGLTANIDIILQGKKDILLIPEVAIKEVSGRKTVEKRNEDESFTEVEIKTGMTDHTYTEVISGLNEGDEIVISK